jgi:hypothetical protein
VSGRDPIDVLREALSHLGPFRGGAADEALAVLERERADREVVANDMEQRAEAAEAALAEALDRPVAIQLLVDAETKRVRRVPEQLVQDRLVVFVQRLFVFIKMFFQFHLNHPQKK